MIAEKMTDKNLKEFLEMVASDSFYPGGGCVSALAGALSAALAKMVLCLTIGKKKYAEFDNENKALLEVMSEKIKILTECIDKDAEGCEKILQALNLPKNTEEEKNKRKLAISDASKVANEAPLTVCENALHILRVLKNSLQKINRNAISDWGVAACQAYTALEGAMLNAKLNCLNIVDENYCKELSEKFSKMLEEGRGLIESIRVEVHRMVENIS